MKKAWNDDTQTVLTEFSSQLETIDFAPEILKQFIQDFAEQKGLGMGKIMMPLRLALVGDLKGPDVPDLLNLLGKKESLERIHQLLKS